MQHRASLAKGALCALALASLLAACGGRFQPTPDPDDLGSGGSPAAGAGASSAGSGNALAGRVGAGGVGAGGAGSGRAGSGSAGAGCPPCLAIGCGIGSHAETLAGNCCPTCVDDADAQCKKGQQAYLVQRDSFLQKYRAGCASSAECVIVAPLNRCERCSYASVWYGAADSLESNLSNSADMYCSSCKLGPIPCPPPPAPECIKGVCDFLVK